MLRFPILYCKGMRSMMFQLSGIHYRVLKGGWFKGRGYKGSREP